ncbi:F-box/FBD/LRR-repeat protein At5g56420-like [Silene latifolia]|uniref:F-box/FBD/LRR-repeat protein At5g56420-like n=1 Tax=Silene latifolia TaxID=37657 RepID=UPI003D7718F2
MTRLRLQKRFRSSKDDFGRDRLSEMPDEVLVHILSCMPTLDAVRTVLLRRFGNLWTLIHTLKFDIREFLHDFYVHWESNEPDQFYLFTRNVLLLHKRLSIEKFHLCVEFDSANDRIKAANDIKMWLRFALDRQAKEIKICDKSDVWLASSSILPSFSSQSLVMLKLDNCEIEPQLQVKLGYLKKLLLDHVKLCDEAFQQFISGCPSLQELGIVNPTWLKKLSFHAPNIGKLSCVLTDGSARDNPLLIDCPNLKSLDLEVDGKPPEIIDVSSLRDIFIKKFMYAIDDYDERTMHKMFLGKFEGTEVLRLSRHASVLFLHTIQYMELLQIRWKRVVLELQELSQNCLLGIYHLLRTLKHLEELVIYTTEDFKASTVSLPSEISSRFETPQLKTITLHGYGKSWKSRLQLVEFLLQCTAVVDKLVIIPH